MRILACVLAALASWGAPALAAEERVVETKRVVVRVTADPGESGYSYVYVDHEDGEPVLLDSVLAERGYLGIELLELTPELREHFGAAEDAGVMISRVVETSPAATAGLRAGDILTAIDGVEVGSSSEVARAVSEGREGQPVRLTVQRDGEMRVVEATLATRPRQQIDLGGLIMAPGGRGRVRRFDLEREAIPMVELDPDSMGRALSLMREHFESPEWREQLRLFGGDREALEERIRELENRLRELESQIEELPE